MFATCLTSSLAWGKTTSQQSSPGGSSSRLGEWAKRKNFHASGEGFGNFGQQHDIRRSGEEELSYGGGEPAALKPTGQFPGGLEIEGVGGSPAATSVYDTRTIAPEFWHFWRLHHVVEAVSYRFHGLWEGPTPAASPALTAESDAEPQAHHRASDANGLLPAR